MSLKFLEITNLIIPTKNDSNTMIEEMCTWIFENLGHTTPIHFSRFHPDYKLLNLPLTPLNTLEKAYKIAKDEGLSFVYLGNIYNTDYDKTTCPNCSKIVIEREVFGIKKMNLDLKGNCKYCGFPISIV